MSLSALTGRLDRAGALASVARAVHCAAMPLVVVLLPLGGFGAGGSVLETLFATASVLIGSASAALGLRFHRSHRPLLLVLGGATLIAIGRSVLSEAPWWKTGLVVAGAGLIASAHALNFRLCRCRECTR
jgi:MerC mercury resistance protein